MLAWLPAPLPASLQEETDTWSRLLLRIAPPAPPASRYESRLRFRRRVSRLRCLAGAFAEPCIVFQRLSLRAGSCSEPTQTTDTQTLHSAFFDHWQMVFHRRPADGGISRTEGRRSEPRVGLGAPTGAWTRNRDPPWTNATPARHKRGSTSASTSAGGGPKQVPPTPTCVASPPPPLLHPLCLERSRPLVATAPHYAQVTRTNPSARLVFTCLPARLSLTAPPHVTTSASKGRDQKRVPEINRALRGAEGAFF